MAESALEPFGVQLRRCRQAAALSLRQLATRVGYDHSYLSQVERGRRPGSAHLATLCDRELSTTGTLTQAFQQTGSTRGGDPRRAAAGRGPLGADRGGDLLEAVRHELAGSFGRSPAVAEWTMLTATYAADFGTTPAAELLAGLTADLDLLHRSADSEAEDLAVPAAEFAVLIALTLSTLGRCRAAARWWRTARVTADSSGVRWIASQTRSWEVIGSPAESDLPGLLPTAVDALVLADQHDPARGVAAQARALAAQARLLAVLGRPDEARKAVRLLPVADEGGPSVFGWASYEPFGVASFVHTVLGDTASAYGSLDRALGLCPAERRREGAELRLLLAECLVADGDVPTGLAIAMATLVELEDQWHSPGLYDAGSRVLAAVQGKELTRPAVRDYRELLRRRPFANRSVGGGSSVEAAQG